MWLHHLRHLTLTNQQRSSRTTAHAKRPMGLAHTRSSSVRQSVGYQTVSGDVGVGMGQVTQTTHHIGLGNPMWGRESNPGPREFSRGSGPGMSGPVAGPRRCRRRWQWQCRRRCPTERPVCVCSLSHVLIESISPDQTTTPSLGKRDAGAGRRARQTRC